MTRSDLTYVYCAVGGATAPRLPRRMPVMPDGARARVIPAGRGVWLVVASVPESTYGSHAITTQLADFDWVAATGTAHHGVIEALHRTRDVVPFRLFSMFTSDERASAQLARSAARIKKTLAAVRGREEWVLRVSAPPPGVANTSAEMSGAAYLAAKAASLSATAIDPALVRRATAIVTALAKLATRTHRGKDPVAANLLIDAAFLVPRSRRAAFVTRAKTLTRPLLALGARQSLTGPWPPYSFGARG